MSDGADVIWQQAIGLWVRDYFSLRPQVGLETLAMIEQRVAREITQIYRGLTEAANDDAENTGAYDDCCIAKWRSDE